jgi:hypothetical protein
MLAFLLLCLDFFTVSDFCFDKDLPNPFVNEAEKYFAYKNKQAVP